MKHILTIISLLVLTFSTIAQRRVSIGYTEIKKGQFDKFGKVSYLVANAQIKKQSGSLRIPIAAKEAKVFKDDNSERHFHTFSFLGDVKGTKLSLVKITDYNSEAFYFVNRLTGTIDTLIGQPVFAQNMKDFVCVNSPGTDEKQQIQVCELINGSINTRVYLNGRANSIIEDVTCINRNSFLIEDNNSRYWKFHFNLSDE